MSKRAFLCAAVLVAAAVAADADLERRVRLKTTRQLKEGLQEIDVWVPTGADKDSLRALAMEHWPKYEEKHPPKVRTSETNKSAGEDGDVKPDWRPFWAMIDKNSDYEVTREEFVALSQGNDNGMFDKMDFDHDGVIDYQEAEEFFEAMKNGIDPTGTVDKSGRTIKLKSNIVNDEADLSKKPAANKESAKAKTEPVAPVDPQHEFLARTIMRNVDTDGDGKIRLSEYLRKASIESAKEQGLSSVEDLFHYMDKDKNGQVDFKEMLKSIQEKHKPAKPPEVVVDV